MGIGAEKATLKATFGVAFATEGVAGATEGVQQTSSEIREDKP
jgi:hypothetical protein